MVAYLWASLRWFRIHHNEVFASFASADYKHFLHFTVQDDGLMMRVIGVEKSASENARQPVRTHLVEEVLIED